MAGLLRREADDHARHAEAGEGGIAKGGAPARPADDAGLAPPPLDPARHALFLDFDGTFVDFAPTPDAVRLRPGGFDLLTRAAADLGGALAMVSGRRVVDLDHYLAPLVLPASGVHGQELRPSGGDIGYRPGNVDLATVRDRLVAAIAPDDPLLLEDKGRAFVLHYRLHPDQRERAALIARDATAGLSSLHVVEGHSIQEIRERGISKALAVPQFLAAPPFAGRVPVFIGDDTTDEDGFRAAAEHGGFGIKVGPGITEAAYRLTDVGAVHGWLGAR